MPKRAPRMCIEGCGRTTHHTRCDRCETLRQPALRATHNRLYDEAWRQLSKTMRARHPRCATCGSSDDLTLDHVAPRSLAAGVMVLCRRCNARKSNR